MVHLTLLAEDLVLSVDSIEFDLVPAGTVALELEKHLEIHQFVACNIKEAIHLLVRATGEQNLTLYSTTCSAETCITSMPTISTVRLLWWCCCTVENIYLALFAGPAHGLQTEKQRKMCET